MRLRIVSLTAALALAWSVAFAVSQRTDVYSESRDHEAIRYSSAPVDSAIAALNRRLEAGAARLTFEPRAGYLRSVLDLLSIPVESQVLIFSQTSSQARRISRDNPRALFFRDDVMVGWVRGGEVIEVAVQDPSQGTLFYTLVQDEAAPARFVRNDQCLSCHLSWETRGVPGPFVQTVFPRRSDDEYANGFVVDHRAPIRERWGGWYVTGARVPPSMANIPLLQPNLPEDGPRLVPATPSLKDAFDLSGYPTTFSDVAALMVLDHQVHATNLLTRAGWEQRIGSPHVQAAIDELVDYLLFVDEAPLPHPVRGSAGFAEAFAARGPRDPKGRSLRELDLETRLMRYPMSYMVYSPGFAGLPPPLKARIVDRIDAILDGRVTGPKYRHLTADVRQAIREIVAGTGAFTGKPAAAGR